MDEIRDATKPLTKQRWYSTLASLNRNKETLDNFNRRLDVALQEFMVCYYTFDRVNFFQIASATRTEGNLAQVKGELQLIKARNYRNYYNCWRSKYAQHLHLLGSDITRFCYSHGRFILIPGGHSSILLDMT